MSGIQKAFIYPLLFAFLYYLARRRLWPTAATVALLGGFYPQMVLVAAGTLGLQLLGWGGGRSGQSLGGGWLKGFGWTRDRQLWKISLLGLVVAFVVLLPHALGDSAYGPVVNEAQARQMPEFFKGGRSAYFRDDDPWAFWMEGRSGLRLTSVLTPATNGLGLLLPLLLSGVGRPGRRLGRRLGLGRAFPLVAQLQPSSGIIPRFLLASGGLFLAAHGLIFRLHLPSRYSGHSLRVALTLTSGIVLVILLDGALGWISARSLVSTGGLGQGSIFVQAKAWGQRAGGAALAALLGISLLFYPFWVADFPIPTYHYAYNKALYAFFRAQPKDSLIASLSREADDLPTMAGRSVLVAAEYAIPYHLGYYEPFRQRMVDLIEAQYSPDPAVVRAFIERYGVDFWLVDLEAFWPDYFEDNRWLYQYQPAAQVAEDRLKAGIEPALLQVRRSCLVTDPIGAQVLAADCILERLAMEPVEPEIAKEGRDGGNVGFTQCRDLL